MSQTLSHPNAWSQLMVGRSDLMFREHPSFPGSLILAGQGELGDVADKLPLGVFNHVEKVGLYTNIHLDGCGLAGWVLGELGEDAFSITQTDQPRYYLVLILAEGHDVFYSGIEDPNKAGCVFWAERRSLSNQSALENRYEM